MVIRKQQKQDLKKAKTQAKRKNPLLRSKFQNTINFI
jgi:hypothetical protein